MRDEIIAIFKNYIPVSSSEYEDKKNFLTWRLTDEEYENLLAAEVMDKLEEACEIEIERFNDVEFTGQNLEKGFTLVESICLQNKTIELEKLKKIFKDGLQRKTGVRFSF